MYLCSTAQYLRPPMGLTNGIGFSDAPYLQIAGPDGADLALLDQPAERLHGFFKGCCSIVAMGVVQIDSVRLQAGGGSCRTRVRSPPR